jgi:site-specific recombinase XerD
VDGRVGGTRVRRSFADPATARTWAEQAAVEVGQEGLGAFELNKDQRQDAARALGLLPPGEPLTDAVKELLAARAMLGGRATVGHASAFWAKHNPDGNAVPLGGLVTRFVDGRIKAGLSAPHVRALRGRLAALVATFGEQSPVAGILPDDVEAFLDSREGLSPRSRNAWLVSLRHFFRAAVKMRLLDLDPTAHLDKAKVVPRPPAFLSAGDCKELLRAAETVAPDYAAAVAILFFAGVRPVELVGQYGLRGRRWEDVDTFGGHIRIRAEISKVNQQRLIPIASNLRSWLIRYGAGKSGRIVPNPMAWKRARAAIEKKAGVKWGQDYARHSFATHHFAEHGSRDLLQAALGHTANSTEIETAYKGLATPAEARRFWAIRPNGATAKNAAQGKGKAQTA